MILNRLGNKSKLAAKIQTYFPPHDMYIEPFFGAGGMFFNKRKAAYNILNDIDSEVFNLFTVVSERPRELEAAFLNMPISEDLWRHWKTNPETDPIRKALRFLMLSNFGLMGKPDTMRFGRSNTANVLLEDIKKTNRFIFGCQFINADFRDVFRKIHVRHEADKNNAFVYCDPPYIGTSNNYSHSFTEADSVDLFDCLQASGYKWAMSEFDNPFILDQAAQRGLVVTTIGERVNMKNRRTEILITNYQNHPTLFD